MLRSTTNAFLPERAVSKEQTDYATKRNEHTKTSEQTANQTTDSYVSQDTDLRLTSDRRLRAFATLRGLPDTVLPALIKMFQMITV